MAFYRLANSNNQTTEVQCIGLDITDLKNAETALKISNERYEYVNKATNDAIFDWNIIEDAIKWGNGFFRMFGFDARLNIHLIAGLHKYIRKIKRGYWIVYWRR